MAINPGYTRRKELRCTLAELSIYGAVVLYEGEALYVLQEDGRYAVKIGDGKTPIADLPYSINYSEINTLKEAADNARLFAEIAKDAAETARAGTEAAVKVAVDKLQKTDENLELRISSIEQHISDDYFVTDADAAHVKTVPERACSAAKLMSVGGMTYKCNNLIPFPYLISSQTINGVTLTFNDDGTIAANGTPESATELELARLRLPKGKYTLSGGNFAKGWFDLFAVIYSEDGSFIDSIGGAESNTFDTSYYEEHGNISVGIQLCMYFSETNYNVLFKPMLNEGSTALPYEPYYEGLRDTKVTEMLSEGVNKFNPYQDYTTSLKQLLVEVGEGSIRALNTVNISSNGAVYVRYMIPIPKKITNVYFKSTTKLIGDTANPYVYLVLYDEDDKKLTDKGFGDVGDFSHTLNAYNYLKGKKGYIGISFYSTMGAADAGDGAEYSNIMLSFDTDMPYVPYKEPISYPIPAEIQVGKGIEGYADTIDFEHKKYIQHIVGIDLGDFTWGLPDTNIFMSTVKAPVKIIDNTSSLCICADYKTYSYNDLYSNRDVEGFAGIGIDAAGYIRVFDGAYTDGASFKEAVKGKIAYCVLETPIETDISEHLEVFDNIIEVEGGGSLEFVNEYEQTVPSAVKYLLKEDGAV